MKRNAKICFVGPYAYSLFNRNTHYRFGGAEVRSYLFSTGLARYQHYDVSYVVLNHNQPKQEVFDNVTIYPHSGYPPTGWMHPGFIVRYHKEIIETGIAKRINRFPFVQLQNKRPMTLFKFGVLAAYLLMGKAIQRIRVLLLWWRDQPKLQIQNYKIDEKKYRIYEEIDADVYCVFGVSDLAGEVAAFCKHAGKKYILFIAAETNLDKRYRAGSNERDLYSSIAFVCHYAIDQADLIFVQTNWQAHHLAERFGKPGIVVQNPVDLTNRVSSSNEQQIALWVGKSDANKQPLLLIRIAKSCPDVQFVMVMNRFAPDIEEQVFQECPDNVTIYDHIPFEDIEEFFSRSFVLINSSNNEGFPNTFLQAGKYGVPILSYKVDPDGFIEKHKCGVVAHGDFDKLVEGMRIIQTDQQKKQQFSKNITRYVETYHGLDDKIQQVDEAIQELIQ